MTDDQTVVYKGAEAVLTKKGDKIDKKRVKKNYRVSKIDNKLREERTELEKRILNKAREAGVAVPEVIDKDKFRLTLEFIEGKKVKSILERNLEISQEIGENIARLHNRNIIHGDLTTSNMIKREDKVYFIDFGLSYFSQRTEDRAMDFHLLKRVLNSTHHTVAEEVFSRVKKNYKKYFDEEKEVFNRLEKIEQRGRYK